MPRRPIGLKDITWQDFVKHNIHEINTWPYLPSGLLKKHEEYDLRKQTADDMEFQGEDWKEVKRLVEQFSEKQKTVLSWILAASIAVLGNLAVNLAFAVPIFADNLFWMLLCLLVVVLLIVLYLKFLPKVTAAFRFIPPYVNFPTGYEQYVTKAPCTKLYSKIIFQWGTLQEKVVDFGKLVRTAILKDQLCFQLKKASYVRISDIIDIGDGIAYFVRISTDGVKPWLDPHGRDKIEAEMREIVTALFHARMQCSVFRFELDPKEWDIHGCDFVDGVSEWKLEEVRKTIINELKTCARRGTPKGFLKLCSKCGKEIPIASEKCPYCGTEQ